MIFKQLFDSQSSTFTYLLADEASKEAVIIDPVFEQVNRDGALIEELGLTLLYSLDTHCHADHVTASWILQQRFGCQIGSAKNINATNVNLRLVHLDTVHFGGLEIEVRATPGHTDGCLTYVCHQHKMAFTGDALLIRGCGRCDFQQGSPQTLFQSIHQQIFTLPDDFILYPAHDYAGRMSTSVDEEKQYNPRLGGMASESDFVGYMKNMALPHPKFIDIALPANLESGRTDVSIEQPDWAPLHLTFSGIYEVEPEWVLQSLNTLQLLDVREETEVNVSRIEGSVTIPLGDLTGRLDELTKDKPTVVLCRSGKRSALAVNILKNNGWHDVANMKGGLLGWTLAGLPVNCH